MAEVPETVSGLAVGVNGGCGVGRVAASRVAVA